MWLSTSSSMVFRKPSYQTAELEAALIERQGIDSSILAIELGVPRHHIEAAQRRLGLRKLTGNPPRKQK